MIVINWETNETLSEQQILEEVNRDRSEDWQDYTLEDLRDCPTDVAMWLDNEYYNVII